MFGGGDYAPLYWSLGILVLVGVMVPPLADFLDLTEVQDDSIVTPLLTLVSEGISVDFGFLGSYSLNFFGMLGSIFQDYIVSLFVAFTYLPNWFNLMLMLFILLGVIYGVIKLLPTT